MAANGNWLNWALTSVRDYVWLLDHRDTLAGPAAGRNLPPARLDDGIRLENVTFAYGEGEEAKRVLSGVDLQFHAGEVVAIVGSNGTGKTTLTKLLLGLHRPTSGRITVDGVELDSIDPVAWRARTTAAPQEHMRPELDAGTAVGIGDLNRLDDDFAIAAASARAGADAVIDGLPSGSATQLGTDWPDGVELSGGEWQRLAVARSAMRTGDQGPLLLVLDEPAAALDPEAEHRLFELYTATADGRAQRGAVTVLVSHRLSTVRDADRIVVLEDGRIVEVGGHDELMVAGGRYAHLFELQARSYR